MTHRTRVLSKESVSDVTLQSSIEQKLAIPFLISIAPFRHCSCRSSWIWLVLLTVVIIRSVHESFSLPVELLPSHPAVWSRKLWNKTVWRLKIIVIAALSHRETEQRPGSIPGTKKEFFQEIRVILQALYLRLVPCGHGGPFMDFGGTSRKWREMIP